MFLNIRVPIEGLPTGVFYRTGGPAQQWFSWLLHCFHRLRTEDRWISRCLLHWASHQYGFTKPWCVNSLWPSNAMWLHRTMSILAQVMACCLMAPSHYLNQFWLSISEVQWQTFIWGQFQVMHQPSIIKFAWKLLIYNFIQISQGSIN